MTLCLDSCSDSQSSASDSTKRALSQKLKEPATILFFRGAVYDFTYNDKNEQFTQSQMAFLYDLPSAEDVARKKKIKVLAAPPGFHDIDNSDLNISKDVYLEKGFKEVKVGIAPSRTQAIGRNVQAQREQYGLKHRVTATIHAAMGDTLNSAAIEISQDNSSFKLWDKAQAIVALSRTKLGKHLIFVGDKSGTIDALAMIIQRRSKWVDYMESILQIITISSQFAVTYNGEQDDEEQFREEDQHETPNNNNHHHHHIPVLESSEFPFRICDISLPESNTGEVYFLMSLKRHSFTYIGMTKNLRTRLNSHNSGYGSNSTCPTHLRPFTVLAYICGFNDNRSMLLYVEKAWKQERDRLISSGVNDVRAWARSGRNVIAGLANNNSFNVQPSELRLILLFREEGNEDSTT